MITSWGLDPPCQRFGLIWVDHETGERIPKDSLSWLGNVAAANAIE